MKFYDRERLTECYGIWAAGSLINGGWELSDSGKAPAVSGACAGVMKAVAEALRQSTFADMRALVGEQTILAVRYHSKAEGEGLDVVIGVVVYDTGDPLAKSLRRLMKRCLKPRPRAAEQHDPPRADGTFDMVTGEAV